MFEENHRELIKQYYECNLANAQVRKKTITIEILVIAIVIGMKLIHLGLAFNILATSCVTILVAWHFWGFKNRRLLDQNITDIIWKGVNLEKQHPLSEETFFQKHLKKFNLIWEIISLAIFDVAIIYFFSVSISQLINLIQPTFVSSSLIRALVISVCLIPSYFRPLKPLIQLKKQN